MLTLLRFLHLVTVIDKIANLATYILFILRMMFHLWIFNDLLKLTHAFVICCCFIAEYSYYITCLEITENTFEPDLFVYEEEEKRLFVTHNYIKIRFR